MDIMIRCVVVVPNHTGTSQIFDVYIDDKIYIKENIESKA